MTNQAVVLLVMGIFLVGVLAWFSSGGFNHAPRTLPVTCRPTGCSGEICADHDVVTDCLYKATYACYHTASCKQQINGRCGWTMTTSLQACVASTRATDPQ